MNDQIVIKGAKQHNLKDVDVTLPRDQLIVFTGLSGSGKSSLAFDTIYAEGQRRYVESLSSYARQFLGQMDKPEVESIEGLSPAISIDQKTTNRNPRSTVGTVTEIHDYLRLLYARMGQPHCPKCGKPIMQQSVDTMVDTMMGMGEGQRILILAPIIRGRKGQHLKVFEDLRKAGYVRVMVDGTVSELTEEFNLNRNQKHDISVVVDRLAIREDAKTRMGDSVETALELSGGLVVIHNNDTGAEMTFSGNYACPDCGISMEEITPRMFSFNAPYGACPECLGLGTLMRVDPEIIIPDKNKSIKEGAIQASGVSNNNDSIMTMYFGALAKHYGFSLDTPVKDLPKEIIDVILYGTKGEQIEVAYDRKYSSGTFTTEFEGIANMIERRHKETNSEYTKADYESYMSTFACPSCKGDRLRPEVLGVTVGEKNIARLSEMPVYEIRDYLDGLVLSEREKIIGDQILKEIRERLSFLIDVGLEYITLSRAAYTLSGGEAQRIRLATQIGSRLMGVLYILDEPSIGLHQRDNNKLLATLKSLRDLGNTLIVVEHDEDTIRAADCIVDIGPLAGEHGGEIIAQGTLSDIIGNERSITGQYMSGKKKIPVPKERRAPSGWLTIKDPRENNLKGMDVEVPLGVFSCVTGVSGSGKSTMVNEILYKALSRDIMRSKARPGKFDHIEGMEQLDKVISIDQSPIGRTPRSNPATYTGVFDLIRGIFADTPDAKARGYKNGRFSFNVKGGRCEACSGDGIVRIEMHFLPDVYVPCEVCKGKRYNRETLEVHYKGKNIYEVLDMTIEEASEFFRPIPKIKAKIDTLMDVGLGYMKLGQPSTTLSGGEAQRVKLATELSRRSTGQTLYILDEPTTGLHVADVDRLVSILQRLVEGGNSVMVIEHNLDVIKTADYIIDLGPEGGDRGGRIVAKGTPEEVAKVKKSYTGQYLKEILERDKD
ncbi:excinuclease ABC subunit UvrA [Eubacteriales bacterium OttesenSCG-928-M02]|nr:excinuclease ABC subunit UvrA [Eubacteriales bacterium OttesenSCG-928-M02]